MAHIIYNKIIIFEIILLIIDHNLKDAWHIQYLTMLNINTLIYLLSSILTLKKTPKKYLNIQFFDI